VAGRAELIAACADCWTLQQAAAWLQALAVLRRLAGRDDTLQRLLHLLPGQHVHEYFWVRARLAVPLELHKAVERLLNDLVKEAKQRERDIRRQVSWIAARGLELAQRFAEYAARLRYTSEVEFGMVVADAGGAGQQQQQQPAAAGGAAAAAAAAPRHCWRWRLSLNAACSGRRHAALEYKVAPATPGGPRPQAVLVQPAAHPAYNNAGEVLLSTQGAGMNDLVALLTVAIPATLLLLQGQRSNLWHSGAVGAQDMAWPQNEQLQQWVQLLDKHPPEQAPGAGFLWLTKVGPDAEASAMVGAFAGVGLGAHPGGIQQQG
jgi:hypothetical protein